jgi:hypothetical protein
MWLGDHQSTIMQDKEARSGWKLQYSIRVVPRNLCRTCKIESVRIIPCIHFGQKTADFCAAKTWWLSSVTQKRGHITPQLDGRCVS